MGAAHIPQATKNIRVRNWRAYICHLLHSEGRANVVYWERTEYHRGRYVKQTSSTGPASMGAIDWFWLCVLGGIWGGSFYFTKIALPDFPPFTLVFLRVFLAALTLFIFLKMTGRRVPTSRKAWRTFLGMGVLNNIIPFSLLFWGQIHIASGLASILNATVPMFTIVTAHFVIQGEHIEKHKLVGIALGVFGVALLIGFDFDMGGSGVGLIALLAMFACLGAALSYGLGNVYSRQSQKVTVDPVAMAFGQFTASTTMMVPIVCIADRPWELAPPSLPAIGAVFGLAVFCSALAYIMYFRLLAKCGPTNVSLVAFLIPISAVILGALFLGERLAGNHFAGMLVIGLGLIAIDGRLMKKNGAKI